MMPVLSDWVRDASSVTVRNIGSRGLRMDEAEIRFVMEKMGSVMSLRKIHRKIAVMRCVLDLESGDLVSAHTIVAASRKYARNNSSLTVDMCGAILRLITSWGYLCLHRDASIDSETNIHVYRRTGLLAT